jgi:hypothetical protein
LIDEKEILQCPEVVHNGKKKKGNVLLGYLYFLER